MAAKPIADWCEECDTRTVTCAASDGFRLLRVCTPCSVELSKLYRVVSAVKSRRAAQYRVVDAKILTDDETESTR